MKKKVIAVMIVLCLLSFMSAQTKPAAPKTTPKTTPTVKPAAPVVKPAPAPAVTPKPVIPAEPPALPVETATQSKTVAGSAENEKNYSRFGLIVNTPSILSPLDSYRSGIGLKILGNKGPDVRLGFDVFVANNANLISGDFSLFLESHFRDGRVSPYWGCGLGAGCTTSGNVSPVDDSTWTRNWLIPANLSLILGTEFFVIHNISLFIEYELAFQFDTTLNYSSLAGEKVNTVDYEYSVDSRLGNNGSIGIVVYFNRKPYK